MVRYCINTAMNFKRTRFLISVLVSSPGILLVHSPLLIGATLISVAIPFVTGNLIDALAYHRSPYAPFVILAALLILRALLTPILQRFICARSRAIETDLQFRVLDATMNLPPAHLANAQNGELVAKLTRDTYAVGGFVRELYPRLLQAIVMSLAASCALFARSPVLSLAFMAFLPFTIFLFKPFARQFAKNSHHVRHQFDISFNSLFDFLSTLPLLRTLDAERRFADVPKTALKSLQDGNVDTDALSVRFGALLGILLSIGEIVVLGFAGAFAAKGVIPVGDVVLYQMLFMSAVQSMQGIISLMPELATIREGADSLGEALGNTPPKHNGRIRIDNLKSLTFHNVSFAYPNDHNHPVIKDFSANLHNGSVVGISGINGAGKSTLLKLAINAMEPQTGEILVNGHPFSEIDIAAFRRRIGIVFQDGLLVTGTVRDNITLRNPAFTPDDIKKALAMSGFDAVVKRLPDGLDTRIGNNLRNLSGGERQRLAIARAVIRDPMILVLDEATNHLDAESRKSLASLIARLRQNRLILIAGHDSELEKSCDTRISCQISENASYTISQGTSVHCI